PGSDSQSNSDARKITRNLSPTLATFGDTGHSPSGRIVRQLQFPRVGVGGEDVAIVAGRGPDPPALDVDDGAHAVPFELIPPTRRRREVTEGSQHRADRR